MPAADAAYTTPSDLAEYAYCPRAREFRRTLGEPPEGPANRAGRRYHARTLRAVRRRWSRGWLYVAIAAVGVALIVLGAGVRPG